MILLWAYLGINFFVLCALWVMLYRSQNMWAGFLFPMLSDHIYMNAGDVSPKRVNALLTIFTIIFLPAVIMYYGLTIVFIIFAVIIMITTDSIKKLIRRTK